MQSLRLSIGFPEEALSPEHRIVCESPAIHRQLILGGHVSDGTETTISSVEGDPAVYKRLLDAEPRIEEHEITATDEDSFFCYVRQPLDGQATTMFEAFHQETIVVLPPFDCRSDRTMRTTIVGATDDVQAMLDGFPDGISVEILRVGDHAGGPIGELTARQREALGIAWECGYYVVPRTGGIEDVAAELGCAVSTASALLRRAESRLVANALDVSR